MKLETSPRDRLFQTAARLFYQHGYRAVGVDTLAAESGIGKMTLYRHYPSKDDLIVAFLRQSDADFWEYFEQSTEGAPTAREAAGLLRILASVRGLADLLWLPFLNLATEYPETDHRATGLRWNTAVRARLHSVGGGSGRVPAGGVGRCSVLADGWRVHGRPDVRQLARQPWRRCGGGRRASD
jgi:AcrR family transcriptional regulator